MSGSTPERLVAATARRLDELHAADGAVSYRTAARHATAAVLRAVAEELFEELLNRVGPAMVVRPNVIPELLRSWAVVVEKGEQDA